MRRPEVLDEEETLPQGERFSKRDVVGYRGQKRDRSRDPLGIGLWVLDRVVVIGAILTAVAAIAVALVELTRRAEEYDGLRSLASIGRLALAWLNSAWPFLAMSLAAWVLAKLIRVIAGRA